MYNLQKSQLMLNQFRQIEELKQHDLVLDNKTQKELSKSLYNPNLYIFTQLPKDVWQNNIQKSINKINKDIQQEEEVRSLSNLYYFFFF